MLHPMVARGASRFMMGAILSVAADGAEIVTGGDDGRIVMTAAAVVRRALSQLMPGVGGSIACRGETICVSLVGRKTGLCGVRGWGAMRHR